jgi:Domain of Unknown Function (DUF1080)
MTKTVPFFILICTFISCSHQFKPLFNGTNLNGWYAFTAEKKFDNAQDIYVVSDNMIRLHGEKVGYLMSNKSYKNFELTVDYRWNIEKQYHRNDNKKNSGVMYNIPTDTPDVLWPKGIQFQVKEGFTGDFVLLDSVTINVKGTKNAAGKSVTLSRFKDNEKPIGEWNTLLIQSKNGHCLQYLNGLLVNEGTDATSKEGRILLQYEGSPIDFKNIKIKKF